MPTKKDKEPEIKTIYPKNLKPILGITTIIILLTFYFLRPIFHGFIMGLYTKPLILIIIVLVIVSIASNLKKARKNLSTVLMILIILSSLTISFNDLIVQNYIVKSTDYNIIDELPESTQLRLLPQIVAKRYMEDSLQKPREMIGGLDIVNYNNTLVWTAPRVPNGGILYFTQKVNGIMTADAVEIDRSTKLITEEMQIGEDIGIFDNIYWVLYKEEYFQNIAEIFYLKDSDKTITVASVIRYKFKFPVMIPYFAGIFKINPDGSMERYSQDQLSDLEFAKNNILYPEDLARLYVDSYKYNMGILNAWFIHEDQIEISDVYGQYNRQPFLMPTEDGMKWVIATEPHGQSYGVFKIYVIDAITGHIDMLELDEDSTLTGPVRVISYVKKKFPTIDWATSAILEPRPYVINSTLYWMLSITPSDFAGISYTVLVDAKNNEIFAFDNKEEVEIFMSGDHTEKPDETPTQNKSSTIEKIEQIEKLLEQLKSDIKE